MRRKFKHFVLLGLFIVTLGGCTFSKDSYAEEGEQEKVTLVEELESVSADEFQDWLDEKVDSGELVGLEGIDGSVMVFSTPGGSVVTDPELLERLNSLNQD